MENILFGTTGKLLRIDLGRGMKRDRLLLLPIKPLNSGEISLPIMS